MNSDKTRVNQSREWIDCDVINGQCLLFDCCLIEEINIRLYPNCAPLTYYQRIFHVQPSTPTLVHTVKVETDIDIHGEKYE